MVKESRKKAKESGSDLEELEIDIESNELADLKVLEKQILSDIALEMKRLLSNEDISSKANLDDIETFALHAVNGSIKVLDYLISKTL